KHGAPRCHAAPAPLCREHGPPRLGAGSLGGAADPLAGPGGGVLAHGPDPARTGVPLGPGRGRPDRGSAPGARPQGSGCPGGAGCCAGPRRTAGPLCAQERRRAPGQDPACAPQAPGSTRPGRLAGPRACGRAGARSGARRHRPLPRGAVRENAARARGGATAGTAGPAGAPGAPAPFHLEGAAPNLTGVTAPPDLPPPSPPTDVPPGPAPDIRPYTGVEDRPGQSTPEVPDTPIPPGIPPPGREVEPPRH